MAHLLAILCALFATLLGGCSSDDSSTSDAVCNNNGGVCTTGTCGNQLPYPCYSATSSPVCCKVATSSSMAPQAH
ncbi:MAG: hypothetical protein ACLQVI_16400 [Polyangiaceae bacterium]|jgi:hypothetical protein